MAFVTVIWKCERRSSSRCPRDIARHTLTRVRLAPREQEAIRNALAALPANHPARVALQRDPDPAVLMQLVEQEDVAQALQEIWFDAYRRRLVSAQARKPG
jgi:hypothetical protein